jgi:rfaE bifunctional protein nucleotidyltransferase chain/domain
MPVSHTSKKIVSRPELKEIVRGLKAQGKKVAFTTGCFDLIQVHHVRSLQEAKKHGDVLVVAINTDESVRKLKGPPRPIVPQKDRGEVVAALECVDYVVFFSEVRCRKILREIRPDIFVKGGDYTRERLVGIVGKDVVERDGVKIVLLKKWRQRSTTKLIERILQKHSSFPRDE